MSTYDKYSELELKDKIITRVRFIDQLIEDKKEWMKTRNEELKEAKSEKEALFKALGEARFRELEEHASHFIENNKDEESDTLVTTQLAS